VSAHNLERDVMGIERACQSRRVTHLSPAAVRRPAELTHRYHVILPQSKS